MTGDEADPKDEQFTLLMAACDEALAAGKTPQELVAPGTPSELRERLQRDLACVHLLRQVLCLDTSQPPGGETVPSAATDAPSNPMLGPAADTPRMEQRAQPMFGSARTASTRLGPYEIVGPLGAGGMGEVYRARDTRLGREVAVKVLPQAFAKDSDRQVRFEREARAVAALSHPNILAIHDYGTHEAVTYAVMELLEGETLRDRLAKGPLSWREAVEIGAAIADGLTAAHAKGIVHRDLKPENLFLTIDGRLKILDFGLARVTPLTGSQSETGPYVPAATDAGTVLGTVGYMSPEQVRGQPADARSDIFSFGCVLYEMVTGRRAFQRETAAETMTAILHDEPADPTGSGNQVPAELGRIIRQCLAKSPNQRLQSAHDLALGLRVTATDPALHRLPAARRFSPRLVGMMAAALVIAVIGASVYLLTRGGNRSGVGKPAAEAKAINALAVLPFDNLGGDPQTEYLSDGVPDTIIHALSRLRQRDLKVRPFTSVARYKGRKPDLEEVGRDLHVGVVVTGWLLQRGDSLSISVSLIDVQEYNQFWGNQYDRKLNDLLALQDEIAKDIAANLRLRLTGEEQQRLTKRYTDNVEAYQAYLKGRFYTAKFTESGLKQGIEYFHQAIQLDRNYALAWAGLANGYWQGNDIHLAPRDAMPKAKQAAQKALAIDDTLAEAHAARGIALTAYDWDWPEAEKEFKQAIALNPDYPTAHALYGWYLSLMKRPEEALAELRRATQLDPGSTEYHGFLGLALYWARRPDQAVAQLQKTLELDPNDWTTRTYLSWVRISQGKFAEAITELQRARQIDDNHYVLATLGQAYALSGNRSEALKAIEQLKEMSKHRYVSPHSRAIVYTGLGENDLAFEWLEKAIEARGEHMGWLKIDLRMDPLRSDPRFDVLLVRMRLSDKIAKPDQDIHSVAVLPFQNVGGDPKTEFLSDGVADQIINSLSQVRRRDLKVRPFTSVTRYKGKELRLASAGRELNVQMIVTGTLRQQEDELAIHVALVDVREEENNLWSFTYQGKRSAILDLQDQIARDVAANLRLRLTGEEEQRLTKRYTEDPEAYLLYREAFYHFNKFTPEGFTTGIDYSKRAIQKDPNYALAYVALARCHIVLGLLYRGPREMFPEARKHVTRALQLDKSLPDAHSTLAQIYIFHDWNWDEAERELKQAIELDPNVVRTHNLYGVWLAAHDRLPEALVRMQRAQELEPFVPGRRYELAMCYNWMGRHDEAIVEAKEALKLDPNLPIAYAEIGMALVQMGKLGEAIAELQKALDPGPSHPWVRGMLGYAYAAAGKRAEAKRELEELKMLAQKQHGFAFAIARIYAALGEKDQAFACLQKACDQRDVFVIRLKVDPTMGSLRSDPRFTRILETMRLPP